MCNNNRDNECQCINEILTVICILQQNANCSDTCLDTCDRGFLGCSTTSVNCNTRPVMLYTCCGNGVAWSMPISKDPTVTTTSNVFRIEKIDGCCATFRVLAENTDETDTNPYVATNSFFTMNLNCVCSLRCLNDTFVCV
ncbi:MAG: hypothetical protein IJB71_04610 [Bacilli bacterium]|nr:hypothetical protein [Bacilli bacterium]